jgi:hypothetical protein
LEIPVSLIDIIYENVGNKAQREQNVSPFMKKCPTKGLLDRSNGKLWNNALVPETMLSIVDISI